MLVTLIVSGLVAAAAAVAGVALSRRAARAAWQRGRREAELEAATAAAALKERAEDLGKRLAGAEARREEAAHALREVQARKGGREATAARVPLREAKREELRARVESAGRDMTDAEKSDSGLESELGEIRELEPAMRE